MSRILAKLGWFTLSIGMTLAAVNALVEARFSDRGETVVVPLYGPEEFKGLILGSSHAMNGIRPPLLDADGLRFFNCAGQGASPRYVERFYRQYRETGRRPSVVVLEADWFMFTYGARDQRFFEFDCGHFPWTAIARIAREPETNTWLLFANRVAVMRDRLPFQLMVTGRLQAEEPRGGTEDRGWVPAKGPPTVPAYEPYPHYRNDEPDQAVAFERLLELLETDRVRVVLVQTPELRVDDPVVEVAQARLEGLARAHGLPFLNYNRQRRSALNDAPANFTDWGHLNPLGAQRFTMALQRDLAAIGVYGQSRDAL